ncbi:hypothetical protein A3A14_00625 [Candidatus Daviesbacteria bacterium RIFCSPLOWO2_01_FULL_43_38]|uniref:Uncharacterized protein n=1 Tax=Candidatus Daviesbacteria bacterium RIFCSPHIGHO2_12_FULL_43_11 TaxID=1797780 RepID=A0A1F5K666_9BACT|nr:MAG: hypothetical protein A3E45_00740 [Candidatus Daviesbacteria bacterium RIFCSPHIGHO2_12_FULL_43_11]OGE63194.1 MAG: hypothetical protein A3A14_00625 [Candidatus Daviesbacteria bacterium RIFCSPLOWO2_01_FULL_43_38]
MEAAVEFLFFSLVLSCVVQVLLFPVFMLRLKKLYPKIWGSPGFYLLFPFPLVKAIRFMFSQWPSEIRDSALLKLRIVLNVTELFGLLSIIGILFLVITSS